MVIMDPQILRDRAEQCRSLALDGDDMHLKAALILLAEEFEREATEIEAKQTAAGAQRASATVS